MKNLLRLLLVIILPQSVLAQNDSALAEWKTINTKNYINSVKLAKTKLTYTEKQIITDSTRSIDGKYFFLRTKTITTEYQIKHANSPKLVPSTITVKEDYSICNIHDDKTLSQPLHKADSVEIARKYLVPKKTKNEISNSTMIVSDAINKRSLYRKYRTLQRQEKPKALILQVGMMNGWAGKTTKVDVPQFEHQSDLNYRQNNEHSRYGFAFTAGLRQEFKKVHSIFANYLFIRQGFVADNAAIDWHTGLPNYTNHAEQDYVFDKSGFELGYSYSGYQNVVNLGFELGLFSLWNYSYNYEGMNVRSLGLKQHTWGGKLAIGPVIKTNKGLEISIMPTIYYDFKAINRGYIRTNLYNIGLSTNIAYSIFRY